MKSSSWVYGLHAVEALLHSRSQTVRSLYVQSQREDQRLKALLLLAEKKQVPIKRIDKERLESFIGDVSHQGVAAECTGEQKTLNENDLWDLLDQLTEPVFLLVLDHVQDPHNLGACLRTADAAGVHAVIAPKDNSVGLTPVVRKVASGAAETVPFIQVTNLARVLDRLKERGVWVMGLAEEANIMIYEQDLSGAIAIVMGQEGAGLRRLTKTACDILLKIPMSGTVSSLNVSVATGVALFEVVRQRKKKL